MPDFIEGRAYPFKSDAAITRHSDKIKCSNSPTLQNINSSRIKRARPFVYIGKDPSDANFIFVFPVLSNSHGDHTLALPSGRRVHGFVNIHELWRIDENVFNNFESTHSGPTPYEYSNFGDDETFQQMKDEAVGQISRLKDVSEFIDPTTLRPLLSTPEA